MTRDSFGDKVKGVITTEVKYAIGIVIFLIGVVGPYYQIRQDIALIQQDIKTINENHLAHMQDLAQQVKDLQEEQVVQNDKIIANQEALIKLLR